MMSVSDSASTVMAGIEFCKAGVEDGFAGNWVLVGMTDEGVNNILFVSYFILFYFLNVNNILLIYL